VLRALPLAYGAWVLASLRSLRSPGSTPAPGVSVVIPARDEAENLPGLLASLARQEPRPEEVVVVDDGSFDATRAVASGYGARVVSGGGGKASSLALGAEATKAPVLVFVDADVLFERSDSLRSVVEELLAIPGGLVSVEPFHAPGTGVEHCSAMANLVSVLSTAVAADRVPGSRTPAVAFGPVMAIRRSDYVALGGHRALLSSTGAEPILDDVMLARLAAASGRRVRWLLGGDLISFRMYRAGRSALVEGWAKNLASGAASAPKLGALAATAWVAGALSSWAVLAGPRTRPLARLGALGLVVSYGAEARSLLRRIGRFSWWTWAALPVSLGAFMVLSAWSAWLTWVRGSVTWRGRVLVAGPRGRS